MKLIVAVDSEFGIGRAGKLAWHCPEDLAEFKRLTMGGVLAVGRHTYNGLPALPGREVIMVGTGGVALCDLPSDCWICGGAGLYSSAEPLCDEMYLTVVEGLHNCDVFWKPGDGWKLVKEKGLARGVTQLHFVR